MGKLRLLDVKLIAADLRDWWWVWRSIPVYMISPLQYIASRNGKNKPWGSMTHPYISFPSSHRNGQSPSKRWTASEFLHSKNHGGNNRINICQKNMLCVLHQTERGVCVCYTCTWGCELCISSHSVSMKSPTQKYPGYCCFLFLPLNSSARAETYFKVPEVDRLHTIQP